MGHVWLIGMMGTGKTTIGAMVAERLGLPIIDSDTVVMERSGRTIRELFADSEETFRTWEASVISELGSGPASVISTGGGVILDQANVDIMANTGIRILLEATPADLKARLANDATRPLINEGADLELIAKDRSDRYRAASDYIVDTSGRDPIDVVEEVIRCVNT